MNKNEEDPPYVGQVIIERSFRTRLAAKRWMERVRDKHKSSPHPVHVETYLWEPPGKEVKRNDSD